MEIKTAVTIMTVIGFVFGGPVGAIVAGFATYFVMSRDKKNTK